MLLLLNKIDLVSREHVDAWMAYLKEQYPNLHILPFSSFPHKDTVTCEDIVVDERRKVATDRLPPCLKARTLYHELCAYLFQQFSARMLSPRFAAASQAWRARRQCGARRGRAPGGVPRVRHTCMRNARTIVVTTCSSNGTVRFALDGFLSSLLFAAVGFVLQARGPHQSRAGGIGVQGARARLGGGKAPKAERRYVLGLEKPQETGARSLAASWHQRAPATYFAARPACTRAPH